MEKSDALLFLGIKSVEERDEAYEEKIFEWKNFFVHRFPVPKLFLKKVVQLERLANAFEILGGKKYDSLKSKQISVEFSENFIEAFHQYSEQRSLLKAELFAAKTAEQIKKVVLQLLSATKAYATIWQDNSLETSNIVVSKEPDPMDLLQAIKDAESRGIHKISEIDKLPEGDLVRNEAKRLSLWLKMEEQ